MDETKGIEAILFLQDMKSSSVSSEMGKDKSEEYARQNWQAMSDADQKWTIQMYNHLTGRD